MTTAPDIPISSLRADLDGRVIAPDDPRYDDARGVFFTGFDRRPAAIVRVADASDVSRVVDLARETGAELAVRSGGHSRAGFGTSEGGIVLDLSEMNAVEIDPEGRTVRCGLGSVAPTPVRAAEAEAFIAGEIDWDGGPSAPPAAVARFGELAAAASSPITDHRSSADYRRRAVQVITARGLQRSLA